MKEGERIKRRLLEQDQNERLFRINAGMGYAGPVASRSGKNVVIKNARPFHAAPKGWPDVCGWETVEITPDMVGQKIARFKFVEVKLTGKLSKEQKQFLDLLESMGGAVEVVRD
jgi:hypothetical protein